MKQSIIVLALIFSLSACSSGFFKPATSKIPGEWTYQRVRVFKPFSLFGEDETEKYIDFSFKFFADGSARYFNSDKSITFSGFWQYRSEWMYNMDRDTDERVHFLDMHFMDDQKELEDVIFFLENVRVSNQRITGTMYVDNVRISIALARKS